MTPAAEPGVDGTPLLAGSGLVKRFGGVTAVDGFSFAVAAGTATGIIGPNGAGKTCLFDMVSGFSRPDEGAITFAGTAIAGRRPHQVARLGLGRTFQTVRLFPDLTVRQNLELSAGHGRAADAPDADDVETTLGRVSMEGFADTVAHDLSYGQQKLVEIAMVLMGRPMLILLDEPVAGINPVLIERVGEILHQLVADGVTLLIVEHNIPFVAGLCDSVLVMAQGRLLMEGSGADVQGDERVLEAFLGGR